MKGKSRLWEPGRSGVSTDTAMARACQTVNSCLALQLTARPPVTTVQTRIRYSPYTDGPYRASASKVG